MKKIIAIVLALSMCLSLTACKSKEARDVEKLIEAIGEVTLEGESTIISAENAYEALEEEDKAEIENYEILTTARTTLDALIYEAEMNAKYDNAIALLNAEDYEGAYHAFVDLGDWKDTLDYIGRFTVLENVVLEETQNLHKNLEELTSVIHYDYDSQGRVIKKTGDYLDYYCFGLGAYTTGNLWTYEYDTNEDLICVKHYTQDGIYLVIEFTYDENHLLTGGSMTTNFGQENLFFEYNDNGQVSRVIFLWHETAGLENAEYGSVLEYIYEDNMLIRREYGGWEGELYYDATPSDFYLDNSRDYQYNENGQLASWAVDTYFAMNSDVDVTFTYGTYYGFDLP